MEMTTGPVVADRLPPTIPTPTSAARSMNALVQVVNELEGTGGRQAQVDQSVTEHPGHRSDIREVDGERLAPEQAGRAYGRIEVDALDQSVGGEQGDRGGFNHRAVVTDADHHALGRGDTRPQARDQGALPAREPMPSLKKRYSRKDSTSLFVLLHGGIRGSGPA